MKKNGILTINAGSSSIKFALFAVENDHDLASTPVLSGQIDGIGTAQVKLVVKNSAGERIAERDLAAQSDHEQSFDAMFAWFGEAAAKSHDSWNFIAVGHRVVHGGELYSQPMTVNAEIIKQLEQFNILAPLHQPHNLVGIRAMIKRMPNTPQIACFDTAFHRTQPKVAQSFALPRALSDEGLKRYGFHGLSYEYIAHVLPEHSKKADGRVVVAHLGNGASMCGMVERKSRITSMGFTAVDGLMMGTRTGSIDPGILLYLMANKGMGEPALTKLLYKESGLLGVSGISQDMRTLLQSKDEAAAEAVELFCYRIVREIGSTAAAIGGIDVLVFTGGIGENAAPVRENVCGKLGWMGIRIDNDANRNRKIDISMPDAPVEVLVIPTNEEWMIAQHSRNLLKG